MWYRLVASLSKASLKASQQRAALQLSTYAVCGLTARRFWSLLAENRFAVDPPYWTVAALIAAVSIVNLINKRREDQRHASAVDQVEVHRPVFVLGHWRSGTTLLHELLSQDDRLAYPSLFQVLRPHTFLTDERGPARRLLRLGPQKRPMDNMRFSLKSPSEDEFALMQLCGHSPMLGWIFPRRAQHYDRYLTFQGVSDDEVRQWQSALRVFLKKLTYRYRRPLVIKSPTHTGRIRLLLDTFPDARFVHIHRNPYRVYQSTERLYRRGVPVLSLQRPVKGRLAETILRRYRLIYDAFFEQRELIPEGQYHEVCFEDLERDVPGQIAGIYERLDLGDFGQAEPKVRAYMDSASGYKKNSYRPLPKRLRERIAAAWQRSFREWGYST
jgi:hypothetical protein